MGATNIRAQITAGNKQFMEAFVRGDAAQMANLYTLKAQLLPPTSDFVRGRDAIRAFWQGALDMGLRQAQLKTVEVESHEKTAIEVGMYTLLTAAGQVADAGKYVVIWKNERGAWKLHRDIWNTSQPGNMK